MTHGDQNALDDDRSYGNSDQQALNESNNCNSVTYAPWAVYVTPNAGVASLEPTRDRHSPRSPRRAIRLKQTVKASARGSRAKLQKHAVGNQLGAVLTVTYRDLPDDPKKDVDQFLKNVRRFYGANFPWAIVSEGVTDSDEHRPHHHVMLPLCCQMDEVASQWTHGDVHIGINPTDNAIRRSVNYLSKTFERQTGSKPRYRRSRKGFVPTYRFDAGSEAEARAIVEMYVPLSAGEYVEIDPRCGGRRILYWETHPERFGI